MKKRVEYLSNGQNQENGRDETRVMVTFLFPFYPLLLLTYFQFFFRFNKQCQEGEEDRKRNLLSFYCETMGKEVCAVLCVRVCVRSRFVVECFRSRERDLP